MKSASAAPDRGGLFTIGRLLLPLLAHPRVAFYLKWTVYLALLANFALYVHDDVAALRASLPPDASPRQIFAGFATSIDTLAWILLIAVFELETRLLDDALFTTAVNRAFHAIKFACYLLIVAAAWGYLDDTLKFYQVESLGVRQDLCAFAEQGLSLQLDAQRYAAIDSAGCASLAAGAELFRIVGQTALVAAPVLEEIRAMGWLDVVNATVWILVVALIDWEVQLQSRDRFGSPALTLVRQVKTLCYAILLGALALWWVYGYALYTWDAFLWIFGFWAIELNLAEWEGERLEELGAAD